MNKEYNINDLDNHTIWENDECAIYLFHHGSDYKTIWFRKINGECHPINKIEFRNATWILKLIHKESLHPTNKQFQLVEANHASESLQERM